MIDKDFLWSQPKSASDSDRPSFWLDSNPEPPWDALWDKQDPGLREPKSEPDETLQAVLWGKHAYFMTRSDPDILSVVDLYGSIEISFKLLSIEPDFPIGRSIDPKNVQLIVIEDSYPLRITPNPFAKQFAEDFFRTVNLDYRGWAVEYTPPPDPEGIKRGAISIRACHRRRFRIEDFDDLLEAFRNRDRFTGQDYWKINDYEMNHSYIGPQDNGLMSMRYYVEITLPDEIVLSPDRWLELLKEWVESPEEYPRDANRALAVIPLIIERQDYYCSYPYADEWRDVSVYVLRAIDQTIGKLPKDRYYQFKREKLEEMDEIIRGYHDY